MDCHGNCTPKTMETPSKGQNIAVKPPALLHLWLHLSFKHLDVISTINKSKDHSLFSHRLDHNAPCQPSPPPPPTPKKKIA